MQPKSVKTQPSYFSYSSYKTWWLCIKLVFVRFHPLSCGEGGVINSSFTSCIDNRSNCEMDIRLQYCNSNMNPPCATLSHIIWLIQMYRGSYKIYSIPCHCDNSLTAKLSLIMGFGSYSLRCESWTNISNICLTPEVGVCLGLTSWH